MEMEEAFRLAQNDTKFIKMRKNLLYTFGATRLPYICISQSLENADQVLIREGEVTADRPQIAVPDEIHSFEGFDHDWSENQEPVSVLLARRISMPPSKYVNKANQAIAQTGPVSAAVERIMNRLEGDHDVRTGVIEAPEQVWALSILLYVGCQVARSASSNVQEHFERMRLRNS